MEQARDKVKNLLQLMITILVISIFVFYGTFLYPYLFFYYNTTPAFQVVTPFSNIIPQGIDYVEADDCFIVSGYTYPEGYSKIMIIDSDNNKVEKDIVDKKGKSFKWHSGGIACHGNFVYVTGGNSKCYVLDKNDLIKSKSKTVKIVGTINTDSNSSFCFVYGNNLFIGEYQFRKKFKTDKTHHIISPNGNLNTAMVFAYPLSNKEKLGVSDKATFALSIGSTVQGMCMDKAGRMYLSASSRRWKDSILYIYDFREVVKTVNYTYDYHGEVIPVFVFDDKALVQKIKVPPNAEGVTADNTDVYLIFESASTRFKYGWLFGTQFVYKMDSKVLFDEQ